MNYRIIRMIKELQYYSPLRRWFFPRYSFQFSPPQLMFLCQCIEQTKGIDGSISEIGCAAGQTTVFLNKYMDASQIEKNYYAIDTFSGFVGDDVDLEINERRKSRSSYTGFKVNSKKWFDFTMRQNRIVRVQSIEGDVNEYDLTRLAPLSLSLLDVDLYRPTKNALPELYEATRPGGMIVVDDCDEKSTRWDGSDQAYKEFVQQIDLPIDIVHGKLGVIRKPV